MMSQAGVRCAPSGKYDFLDGLLAGPIRAVDESSEVRIVLHCPNDCNLLILIQLFHALELQNIEPCLNTSELHILLAIPVAEG